MEVLVIYRGATGWVEMGPLKNYGGWRDVGRKGDWVRGVLKIVGGR